MQILRVNKVSVNFAGREIFRDLSWEIGDRDRIALVGPNGAGKSTLLEGAAGRCRGRARAYLARDRAADRLFAAGYCAAGGRDHARDGAGQAA